MLLILPLGELCTCRVLILLCTPFSDFLAFPQEHNKAVGAYADQLKDFDKKLEEMQGFIQKAQMQTNDAGERNRNNKLFG